MSWLVSQFENHKDEIQKFLCSLMILKNRKHYVDDEKNLTSKSKTVYDTALYNLKLQLKSKSEVDRSEKKEGDEKLNDCMNISDASLSENISKFDVCDSVSDEILYFDLFV